MDTRLKIETSRDRLNDCQEGLAHSLAGAELPVETAAYLASAQRRVTDAIADLDKATRFLKFDGAVQRLMVKHLDGTTAIIEGRREARVS